MSAHPSPRRASSRTRRSLFSSLEPLESRIAPATFTVANLTDAGDGSLRKAVDDANLHAGADTIKFAPALAGLLTLTTGELLVTDSLTVLGGNKITISGNDASRIFNATPTDGKNHPFTLNGLTLVHGKATATAADAGGAVLSYNTTTLIDCTITNSTAVVGGGVEVRLADALKGAFTLKGSLISDNTAERGGGLDVSCNTITISDSTFEGNASAGGTGGGGGGAYLYTSHAQGGAKIKVTNSIFNANVVTTAGNDGGGGLLIRGPVGVTGMMTSITGCTFYNNASAENGGGVSLFGQGSFTFKNDLISKNTAARAGGGLYSFGSDRLSVSGSVISGNTSSSALGGGGVYTSPFVKEGIAAFTSTQIIGNNATGMGSQGGGILVDFGKLQVTASLVSGNTSSVGGGGGIATTTAIFSSSSADVTITRSTIASNFSGGPGGGLKLAGDGAISISRSSILANYSTGGVGGAALSTSKTIKLSGNHILGNKSNAGAGGLLLNGTATASFSFAGDLIAQNEGSTTGGLEITGAIAGVLAKTLRVTHNVGSGAAFAGGITQSSTSVVKKLAVILGNLNRTTVANDELFGTFA